MNVLRPAVRSEITAVTMRSPAEATIAVVELSPLTRETAAVSTPAKMSVTPSKIHSMVMTRQVLGADVPNPLTMLRVGNSCPRASRSAILLREAPGASRRYRDLALTLSPECVFLPESTRGSSSAGLA